MKFPRKGKITKHSLPEASKAITKTRLLKYTVNFTAKNWKFSDKNSNIFFIFLLKT